MHTAYRFHTSSGFTWFCQMYQTPLRHQSLEESMFCYVSHWLSLWHNTELLFAFFWSVHPQLAFCSLCCQHFPCLWLKLFASLPLISCSPCKSQAFLTQQTSAQCLRTALVNNKGVIYFLQTYMWWFMSSICSKHCPEIPVLFRASLLIIDYSDSYFLY